jgi:predicted phage terminase large subunit-like protein
LHIDDLTGFVLGQSDNWTVLSLPAIAELHEDIMLPFERVHRRRPGDLLAPEREPERVLDELRKALGGDVFSAQYQQAPVPPGGAMIKRHWVQRYTEPPVHQTRVIVQSWDTAAKGGPDNDWSVCTTWLSVEEAWYLLDVWRARVDYPTLKAKVKELAKLWRADSVLIEETGTAVGLLEELKFQVRGLIGIKPDRDKISRMSVASAVIEAGQVFLPERAPWLGEFEAELFAFPGSKFDDQVDSVSQALNHGKSGVWMWIRMARQ